MAEPQQFNATVPEDMTLSGGKVIPKGTYTVFRVEASNPYEVLGVDLIGLPDDTIRVSLSVVEYNTIKPRLERI
jgi:hypothetical protein